MNNLVNRFLFYLFFIFLSLPSFAQNHQIGLSIGNGIATTLDKSWFIFDFKKNNFSTIEFSYLYSPHEAIFNLNTGLNYNYLEGNGLFKIPAGIDFIFGRKIQFLIGGGIYVRSLVFKNAILTEENIYAVQLGGLLRIGILVKMKENISVGLSYDTNNDLTAIFTERSRSPGGAFYSEKKYLKSNHLSLGLFYKLSKK
ncbi:MAG: hypothetical protein IT232_05000 [Flavobacteriales bacterium]|nr:hypothetical protein [Flavobacteriales bacterium]